MKFTVAAVFTALVSAVYAQTTPPNAGVAVTHPGLGEVVTAGNTFTIKWDPIANYASPAANINSISLLKGSSGALDVSIANILSAPIAASAREYQWNVPVTQETLVSYAVSLTGDNGQVTYSPYFTILAVPAGTATNYTAAAPAPAASGSSPAASGSAPAASGSANGTTSGTASSPKASESSAANSLKAGLVGAAGIAGAVALLL
ncbi:uncharacterized protein EV154DRAFT_495230 [Mucor mucedo]|uniref:uncharacterized protein n=1 Tax=Mucor mucedo TaxID=29922 RepID=UPI00221F969A|nr:uncharacterized protein EV154DRAFT_495230 [Mucor mucedo]KAI7895547.1 hypothetical protein EV154DRAFT_495230 [Mucor mucedo]